MGQQKLFSQLQTVGKGPFCWVITSPVITQEKRRFAKWKSFKRFLSVFSAETSLPGETRDGGCLMSEALPSCSMFHSNKIYIQFSKEPETCTEKLAGREQTLSISHQNQI